MWIKGRKELSLLSRPANLPVTHENNFLITNPCLRNLQLWWLRRRQFNCVLWLLSALCTSKVLWVYNKLENSWERLVLQQLHSLWISIIPENSLCSLLSKRWVDAANEPLLLDQQVWERAKISSDQEIFEERNGKIRRLLWRWNDLLKARLHSTLLVGPFILCQMDSVQQRFARHRARYRSKGRSPSTVCSF